MFDMCLMFSSSFSLALLRSPINIEAKKFHLHKYVGIFVFLSIFLLIFLSGGWGSVRAKSNMFYLN